MTHESLEYAAQYVLAELPFFLNANPIINTQETFGLSCTMGIRYEYL